MPNLHLGTGGMKLWNIETRKELPSVSHLESHGVISCAMWMKMRHAPTDMLCYGTGMGYIVFLCSNPVNVSLPLIINARLQNVIYRRYSKKSIPRDWAQGLKSLALLGTHCLTTHVALLSGCVTTLFRSSRLLLPHSSSQCLRVISRIVYQRQLHLAIMEAFMCSDCTMGRCE